MSVDATLLALWRQAEGRTLDQVLAEFSPPGASPLATHAALACLAEAGLLERSGGPPSPAPSESDHETVPGELVSIVMVNYNSLEWLEPCLASLFAQTHTPLEVIVVDNASTDGSVAWLQDRHPGVTLVCLEALAPLSQALNRGVQLAQGAYTLLLNPDVLLAPDAVAQMVAVARDDPACAAVAAKLRFLWAPAFLNGLGNRVGAFSWGTDNGLGHLDLGQFDGWQDVPSACFAATLIPRWALGAVGAFDENFALYYEDSEWSYRARLLGYAVRAAPQAVVYHAFARRVPTGENTDLTPSKLSHVVYGRMRFAVKLLERRQLARFLRNYLLEDEIGHLASLLRLQMGPVRAYWRAWRRFWRDLPDLRRARRALQNQRVRSDRDLFALQQGLSPPFIRKGLPELTWDLVQNHYLPLIQSGETRPLPELRSHTDRPHVLIVSNDLVDTKMAGPGMRYLEMARALSSDLDVTLAIPGESSLELPEIRLATYEENRPQSLRALVTDCDVALISGQILNKAPFLQDVAARLVIDLYDPFLLENLHYYRQEPILYQQDLNTQAVELTNQLARVGDFFLCGSERQRDFWMGVLAANGRVNPQTFAQDQDLRALIDVVGIGFPDREPQHQPLLRGVHPQVPEEAAIILWGGGIWDWLDPLSLVRAWPQVLGRFPQARLVFLGTRHPNPLIPQHQMAIQAEQLAEEIGEKGRSILFFEWLPYEERESLLVEADVGVTLHPRHVETRYAIRTRILDYFWARLPVLVSDGDVTSEWVRQYGLGRVVPPLDVEAIASALGDLLERPKESWSPAFEPLQAVFSWRETVAPLRRYCLQGQAAADRGQRGSRLAAAPTGRRWRRNLARARFIWRTQGGRALAHRMWRYLQWRFSRP